MIQHIEKRESGVGFALAMLLLGIFFIWVASQVLHSPFVLSDWVGDAVRTVSVLAVIICVVPAAWTMTWALIRLVANSERKNLLPYQLPPTPITFVVKEYRPEE